LETIPEYFVRISDVRVKSKAGFYSVFWYFKISKKKLLSAYKTFALLYPMCSILLEDDGLGKSRAPARLLIESDSLGVLEN
jgi:hypothetical protein